MMVHKGAEPQHAPIIGIACMVVFSPLLDGGTTHLAVMVIRLMILSLLGLLFWNSVTNRQLTWPSLPIGMPVMIFLTLALLSVLFSDYTNQSWQWLLVLASYALFLYLITSFVTQWEHIRTIAVAILCVGTAEAAWALWQGLIWKVQRSHGTFFNPNFLAGYLCVSWTLLIGLLVCLRIRWRCVCSPKSFRAMTILAITGILAILLGALIWTGSRGGLIAMMAGTGVVLALRYGLWRATAVIVMALTCLMMVPNPIRERSIDEHMANTASYARWHMWQRALAIMADHPLGVGLGLYQYISPRYAFPIEGEITRYGRSAQTPHNEYLQIGVELGLAAIAVFVWAVILTGRHVAFLLKQRLTRWQRGMILGMSGGVASILTHAALDSNLHEPAIAILFTVCLGLLFCAASFPLRYQQSVTIVPMRSRRLWGVLTAALVLTLGFEIVRLGVAWSAFETGSRHSSEHQISAAIESLRLAASLDPGKALYHRALAMQYVNQYEQAGKHEAARAALQELERATELNPLDGRLHGLLGDLYFQWSFLHEALGQEQRRVLQGNSLRAYHRAAELAPFVAYYRFRLAKLYSLLGDPRSAEQHARELLLLEPNYLPARGLLAGLYVDLKRISEARQELQEIHERRLRFASWPKNPLEVSFLTVDVAPIRVVLDQQQTSG